MQQEQVNIGHLDCLREYRRVLAHLTINYAVARHDPDQRPEYFHRAQGPGVDYLLLKGGKRLPLKAPPKVLGSFGRRLAPTVTGIPRIETPNAYEPASFLYMEGRQKSPACRRPTRDDH